eukprot:m.63927 g.63927  ORF g.63927 m.63927 type:complete len:349 (+) comp11979_c0_seq1:79-1125(+)
MAAVDAVDDDVSLNTLVLDVLACAQKLPTLNAQSDEYKECRKSGLVKARTAEALTRRLGLLSDGEHHTEHSAQTLRCLLLPVLEAEFLSRDFADPRDPERDEKRIRNLKLCLEQLKHFLMSMINFGFDFAPRESLEYYVELQPGQKRDREAKMAHLTATKAADATLKEFTAQMEAAGGESADEELVLQHTLALLHFHTLKAMEQVEMVGVEMDMLEKMAAMRMQRGPAAAMAPPEPPKGKPEKPLVLTADMVKQMTLSGETVNRSNFKLITKGWGRIGAPTMSLEEVAAKEIKQAQEAQARSDEAERERAAIDPDSEEAIEAERQKALSMDEWHDTHKRGEGNRYNKG